MIKHVCLWLLLIFAATLLVPALLGPVAAMGRVDADLEAVASAFGAAQGRRVVERANRQYESLFARDEASGAGAGAAGQARSPANAYLTSFAACAYSMLVRLNAFAVWFPCVAPFLFAALVDGAVRRRIKLASFGFFSPVLLGFALHATIAMAFLPVVYVIAPLRIPPDWIPFWALPAGLPLMALAANIQRVRGE